MYVAWLTMSPVNAQTFVKYGPSQNDLKYTVVSEDVHSFTDNGAQRSVRYVNTARMVNLKPDSYYYYSVGSVRGMSKVFRFKTFPQGEFPIRICIYGDLGIVNGQFDDIINGAEKDYDMVIHVGDIAYDLFKEDGTYGDEFFRKMEPVTSSMPYMVIPGNHEQEPAQDFLHYRKRMKMPGKTEGYYYSFDVGLFHFAGLNSEFYALEWIQQAKDQYNWLEKDLDKVTVPWIFTAIHRPMYCSNSGYSEDCNRPDNEVIRVGNSQMPGLEKLYRDKGVDFAFYGHMHSYERMWPVYNKVTYEQPKAGLTYNSPTPIHVITGSAGCHTPHTPQDSNEKWSCVRSEDFGFTIVHLHNSTHAHLRQFSTEQHRNVDDYWLVKQKGYRPGQA
uniref:Purple acid phosphatase n=1 Tax=Steinernema glaseri TaxID=37863 RepID=A0A1I7YMB1_9BILA